MNPGRDLALKALLDAVTCADAKRPIDGRTKIDEEGKVLEANDSFKVGYMQNAIKQALNLLGHSPPFTR